MNFTTDETRLRSDFEKVLDVLKHTPRIDPAFRIGKEEFQERCRKVQNALAENGYDIGFVFSDEHYCGDVPYLGIWAKPGAPYVCLEPWYGVNDGREVKADISEKRGIQRLAEGETFEFFWNAEIIK